MIKFMTLITAGKDKTLQRDYRIPGKPLKFDLSHGDLVLYYNDCYAPFDVRVLFTNENSPVSSRWGYYDTVVGMFNTYHLYFKTAASVQSLNKEDGLL